MHPDDGARDEAIATRSLARLARGLEAGGIYNGAKLLRALLDRELTSMGIDGPPDAAATSEGVGQLADALAEAGEDDALVAALRAAAAAAGAGATLPLADAPRAWTCRACGRVSLGAVPAWCPACDAPAATAREHIPVWYLEPITPADAIRELEAGMAALAEVVAGLPDEALARPPRAGEWSARETLQHLVAAEELLATRVPRILSEDDPELVAAAAWVLPASDEATIVSDRPASALLAHLRASRQATLVRLRTLGDGDWQRTGRHPEWGTVTVASQAGYFARHMWSHLAQVRAAADGRVPGRPGA